MLHSLMDFWAQHAPVLSVVLPMLGAVLLLLIGDAGGMAGQGGGHDDARLRWRRRVAMLVTLAGLAMAVGLVHMAQGGELMVYRLGDWPAPFGIVMVVDRLSAMMVLLTYLVAVPVLWYASGGGMAAAAISMRCSSSS